MMNLFGSTEDLKFFFFYGLTVVGTKEKKNEEKTCRKLEWAIAHFHFVLGHDTLNCIVTQV